MSVLEIRRFGPVANLRLNRPHVLNALNSELRFALNGAWEDALGDSSIKVVVVSSSGDRAFSVGRDLKETAQAYNAGRAPAYEDRNIYGYPPDDFPKPIIAAIGGFCLGSGFRIAMGCHIRVAAATAQFGNPQIKRGRGTHMPRILRRAGIPDAVVFDMVLTGEFLNAEDALRWGIVSRVVERPAELEGVALQLAQDVAEGSALVRDGIMRAHALGLLWDPRTTGAVYERVTGMMGTTIDAKEGADAFVRDRKANDCGDTRDD